MKPLRWVGLFPFLLASTGCSHHTIGADDFFHPWKFRLPIPTARFEHQVVSLQRPDGAVLRGVRVSHPEPKRALLYFTGNHEAVYDWVGELDLLADAYQADVLALDYRGVGMSDPAFPKGAETFAVLRADAAAACDELRRRAPDQDLYLIGFSLGAAIAQHVPPCGR